MKLLVCCTSNFYDISYYKDILKHYNLEGPIKSGRSSYYTIDINNIEELYKLKHDLDHELIVTGDWSPNQSIDKTLEIYDDYRE